MKRNFQLGFTLIELVIVIIILGILAVTAAPKFLNLQDDARKSAAQGVQASLQSAAHLVYSKASLEGVENTSAATSLSGYPNISVIYGYPTASTVENAVELDGWSVSGAISSSVDFYPENINGNTCYITYEQATSASSFSVELKNCSS